MKPHNRDIDLIDVLVARYKNSEVQDRNLALKELLEKFDDYFKKYVSILHGGEINFRNGDTFKFLALFLAGRPKTTQSLGLIRKNMAKLMRHYDREDVYHELLLIFIGLLDKYEVRANEQGRVNFVYYITKYFRFRTKDWFNKLTSDALMNDPIYIDEEREDADGNTTSFSLEAILDDGSEVSIEETLDLKRMDMAWVMNSKDPLFRELTNYERFILYNHFVLKKSVQAIAETFGRDKDTVWRHYHAILAKLRSRVGADGEITSSRQREEGTNLERVSI